MDKIDKKSLQRNTKYAIGGMGREGDWKEKKSYPKSYPSDNKYRKFVIIFCLVTLSLIGLFKLNGVSFGGLYWFLPVFSVLCLAWLGVDYYNEKKEAKELRLEEEFREQKECFRIEKERVDKGLNNVEVGFTKPDTQNYPVRYPEITQEEIDKIPEDCLITGLIVKNKTSGENQMFSNNRWTTVIEPKTMSQRFAKEELTRERIEAAHGKLR